MARLIAKPAAEGLVPLTIGDCTLDAIDHAAVTWVSPFDGQVDVVAAALGLPWPAPHQTTANETHRAIWVGPDQALIIGAPVAPEGAAVADHSSAWATFLLSGLSAPDVLSRLTPLDVRDAAFPQGATARTLIGHMTASLTRTGSDSFEIMVFRSMAGTAVHDITRAMKSVQARAAL